MMKVFTLTFRYTPVFCAVVLLALSFAAKAQPLISQGKTAYASSTESGYSPGNAVDGSSTTKWSSTSASYNESLYVDLGAVYDIDKVLIYFADGRYALTFDIMVSNDAVNWTIIRTIPPTNTKSSLAILGLIGSGRYVKFNGRGRANPAGYRISEFKVYGTLTSTSTQISDMATISSRLNYGYAIDEVQDLRSLADSMNPDGSWNISYSGTAWTSHVLRLRRMAAACNNPSNLAYHYSTIPAKFMLGVRYFISHHFTSTNWHDTTVRAPNNFIIGLMLMKGFIPADSVYLYANYVVDDADNPGHNGVNRVWVSSIRMRKGLLLKRYPLTSQGYTGIASALNLVTGNDAEGMMNDNSFHQHKDQLYNGAYGRALLEDAPVYVRVAAGTDVDQLISSAQRQNLSNMALGGNQVLAYRAVNDFGTIGRGVSGPGGLTDLADKAIDTLKLVDAANAAAYDNWKSHRAGGAFPSAYFGDKYFWRSAILTSHGANYYMSAKVISTRTEGTERILNENLKGYNLPLGATNIMTSGNEYFDIFPSWNWSCVPGTTAEMSDAAASIALPTGYETGTNTYGGGAAWSDMGAIAYEHNYNSITAKKAYFFLEDKMVCMGNSITGSKSNEVVTTINQTRTSGAVSYNNGSTQTLTVDSLSANTIQWIHHDNVGYIFPLGGYMTIINRNQTGTWQSIAADGSSTPQTNSVFTAYFRHSPTPSNRSYSYIVAPNKLLSDMPALAAGHGITIVSNTSNVQAIRFTGTNNKYAAIFYNAGTVNMGDGVTITSNNKAVVLIKKYSKQFRVSVADPSYSLSSLSITINYNGTDIPVVVSLPTGDYTGSTVTGFYDFPAASLMAVTRNNNTLAEPTDSKEIVLYPNPATSTINVSGLDGPTELEIYDLSGHTFGKTHGTAINISSLPPGAKYFLRIHVNGKVISKQFIKQ